MTSFEYITKVDEQLLLPYQLKCNTQVEVLRVPAFNLLRVSFVIYLLLRSSYLPSSHHLRLQVHEAFISMAIFLGN